MRKAVGQSKGSGSSGILSVMLRKSMRKGRSCSDVPQAAPQHFVAQGLLEPVVVAVSLTGPDGILFHEFVQAHLWSIITSPNASMRSPLLQLFTNEKICQ